MCLANDGRASATRAREPNATPLQPPLVVVGVGVVAAAVAEQMVGWQPGALYRLWHPAPVTQPVPQSVPSLGA